MAIFLKTLKLKFSKKRKVIFRHGYEVDMDTEGGLVQRGKSDMPHARQEGVGITQVMSNPFESDIGTRTDILTVIMARISASVGSLAKWSGFSGAPNFQSVHGPLLASKMILATKGLFDRTGTDVLD